ncbi:MAG: hypothetical protein LBR37_03465 [Erysipelotrichaceae bacterium]|jgi:hypothetical protein|nr:hypothetical protein [Erysipelotrichaceae bacterium]
MGVSLVIMTIVLSLGDTSNAAESNMLIKNAPIIGADIGRKPVAEPPVRRLYETGIDFFNSMEVHFDRTETWVEDGVTRRSPQLFGVASLGREDFDFKITGDFETPHDSFIVDRDYYPIYVYGPGFLTLKVQVDYPIDGVTEPEHALFQVKTIKQDVVYMGYYQFSEPQVAENHTVGMRQKLYRSFEGNSCIHIKEPTLFFLAASYLVPERSNSPHQGTYKMTGSYVYDTDDFIDLDKEISTMRFNKGAKMALWLSNYDLFSERKNVKPFSTPVGSSFKIAEHLHAKAHGMRNGTIHEQAALYIFDRDIKVMTGKILQALKEELTPIHIELVRRKAVIESFIVKADLLSGALSIVGTLSQGFPPLSVVLKGFAFGIELALPIISYFIPTKEIEAIEKFFQYADALENVVTMSINNTVDTLRLPIFYKISNGVAQYFEKDLYGSYHFTYDGAIDVIPAIEGNFEGNRTVRGTVYPIRNKADFDKALRREKIYQEDVVTGGVTQLPTGQRNDWYGHSIGLRFGEYKWFRFLAPHDDTYTFRFHSYGNVTVELFKEPVPGRSAINLIDAYSTKDQTAEFSKAMETDDHYFIRVRETDWGELPLEGLNTFIGVMHDKNITYNKVPDTHYHIVKDEFGQEYMEECHSDPYYGEKHEPSFLERFTRGYIRDPRICHHCYQMIDSHFVPPRGLDFEDKFPEGPDFVTLEGSYFIKNTDSISESTLAFDIEEGVSRIWYCLGLENANKIFIMNTTVSIETLDSHNEWKRQREIPANDFINSKNYETIVSSGTTKIRFIITTRIGSAAERGKVSLSDLYFFRSLV